MKTPTRQQLRGFFIFMIVLLCVYALTTLAQPPFKSSSLEKSNNILQIRVSRAPLSVTIVRMDKLSYLAELEISQDTGLKLPVGEYLVLIYDPQADMSSVEKINLATGLKETLVTSVRPTLRKVTIEVLYENGKHFSGKALLLFLFGPNRIVRVAEIKSGIVTLDVFVPSILIVKAGENAGVALVSTNHVTCILRKTSLLLTSYASAPPRTLGTSELPESMPSREKSLASRPRINFMFIIVVVFIAFLVAFVMFYGTRAIVLRKYAEIGRDTVETQGRETE